nr:hypothetical protein GCM10020092_075300 [Actinoplanes digitatis]
MLMSVIPGSETSGIAFSARRPLLATADDDKGVVVWDVGSMLATARDPLPAACRRSGGLSESEWRRYVSEVPFRRACR